MFSCFSDSHRVNVSVSFAVCHEGQWGTEKVEVKKRRGEAAYSLHHSEWSVETGGNQSASTTHSHDGRVEQ